MPGTRPADSQQLPRWCRPLPGARRPPASDEALLTPHQHKPATGRASPGMGQAGWGVRLIWHQCNDRPWQTTFWSSERFFCRAAGELKDWIFAHLLGWGAGCRAARRALAERLPGGLCAGGAGGPFGGGGARARGGFGHAGDAEGSGHGHGGPGAQRTRLACRGPGVVQAQSCSMCMRVRLYAAGGAQAQACSTSGAGGVQAQASRHNNRVRSRHEGAFEMQTWKQLAQAVCAVCQRTSIQRLRLGVLASIFVEALFGDLHMSMHGCLSTQNGPHPCEPTYSC